MYKKTHEGNGPLVDVAKRFRGETKLPPEEDEDTIEPKTEEGRKESLVVPRPKPDWNFQKVDAKTGRGEIFTRRLERRSYPLRPV